MSRDRLNALMALYLGGTSPQRKPVSAKQRAQDLIAAMDAGGVPLSPFIVNDIARQLGLTVTAEACMADTIKKIRHTLGADEGKRL